MFFLHDPAGTGKTFTYNTLCYILHGDLKIVLCCASSSIAVLLLPKGQTAHSTFKIPIEIEIGMSCTHLQVPASTTMGITVGNLYLQVADIHTHRFLQIQVWIF